MGNMGYCRFYNTLADLRDCYAHMDDTDLSPEEDREKKALIKLCGRIFDDYGDDE